MLFSRIVKNTFFLTILLASSAIHCVDKAVVEKKVKQQDTQLKTKETNPVKEAKVKSESKAEQKQDKKTEIFYDLGSGTGKVTVQALLHNPSNPDAAKDVIADYYQDIRAEIPEQEREMITRGKGSPVYGEILPQSFQEVLEDKELNVGTIKKATGVELSPTRYHHAKTIRNKLEDENLLPKGKTLEFKNENIAETNIDDATLIFMCSTCYPDELMDTLVERFSKLKEGLRVISLKEMPNYAKFGFIEIKELKKPMTWSPNGSPVHLYKLDKAAAKKAKAKESKEADETKESKKDEVKETPKTSKKLKIATKK